jgi:hypothetical protein
MEWLKHVLSRFSRRSRWIVPLCIFGIILLNLMATSFLAYMLTEAKQELEEYRNEELIEIAIVGFLSVLRHDTELQENVDTGKFEERLLFGILEPKNVESVVSLEDGELGFTVLISAEEDELCTVRCTYFSSHTETGRTVMWVGPRRNLKPLMAPRGDEVWKRES